jgi:hypothetical protein
MRSEKGQGGAHDLTRPLIVVHRVKAVVSCRVVQQIERTIALQHHPNQFIETCIQVRIVQTGAGEKQGRKAAILPNVGGHRKFGEKARLQTSSL